jgi:2-polyprenyl-3-methyl-5-hydroxy-6-metoxy-1,4-benzoquinol methylase
MPLKIPKDWPKWPESGLEHLGQCPVCESKDRSLLYENLIDRWFHSPGLWTMHLCNSCKSCYIDPRPDINTIGLAYQNYETHREICTQHTSHRFSTQLRNGYLNIKYGYQMAPQNFLGFPLMYLLPPPLKLEWDHYARHMHKPIPGHNKLLDVGCGNGEFLARARWQGWDVYGIDADESALKFAKAAGIHVTQSGVKSDAYPANYFDAITSHQVIEHAHDPKYFLKTIYNWLKPGGRLWLGTPNATSALHKEFGKNWCNLHPPQHIVILSPSALTTLMADIGFSDIKLLPRGYLDSHFYRQSSKLRDTETVGDWNSLNQDTPTLSLLRQIKLELRAWLRPEECSDLIVVAWKPLR